MKGFNFRGLVKEIERMKGMLLVRVLVLVSAKHGSTDHQLHSARGLEFRPLDNCSLPRLWTLGGKNRCVPLLHRS